MSNKFRRTSLLTGEARAASNPLIESIEVRAEREIPLLPMVLTRPLASEGPRAGCSSVNQGRYMYLYIAAVRVYREICGPPINIVTILINPALGFRRAEGGVFFG